MNEPEAAYRIWLAHLARRPDERELPSKAVWRLMAEAADLHRLRGLTYRRLMDGPFRDRMPDPIRDRLRRAYVDSAVRNALLLRHTAQVGSALAAEEIETIVLKGVHLCRFVYDEPSLRSMADVDLMVPRARLADAEQVFLARGFGPRPSTSIDERCRWSNHLAKLSKDGEPVFEVHWHIERPRSPFQIDLDGLWARSVPAELEGTPVRLLAPEDLIIHVALHGTYHHGFERGALKMLTDLDAIVARHGTTIDWNALTARANDWAASGFVFVALAMTRKLLDTSIPMGVFDRLRHDAEDEAVAEVSGRYVVGLGVDVPSAYLDLARTRGFVDRCRHVVRHAFPSRAVMEDIYHLRPEASLPLAYLRRLGYLVHRRGGLLLRALFRRRIRRTADDRQAARGRIERWVAHGSDDAPSD